MRKLFFLLVFMVPTLLPAQTTERKSLAGTRPALAAKNMANRPTRANDKRQGIVATLKYEQIADMAVARTGHQIFPSGSGFVVAGGQTSGKQPVKTAEVYNNGIWKSLALSAAHDDGFSALLDDGRMMVGGGFTAAGSQGHGRATDIFNPSTQTFTAGPAMTTGRAGCKAVMAGGKLYVSGNSDAPDNVMDCYDGTKFTAVGNMDARLYPYLFTDSKGNITALSVLKPDGFLMDFYTYSDGSQGLVADYYDVSTGKTTYISTPYYENLLPLPLADDARSTDYCFYANGKKYYLIQAAMMDGDTYSILLLFYDPDERKTYNFSSLHLPMTHPDSGEEIDYRGGVIVNQNRQEIYIIGSSGYWEQQTLHVISFNYSTEEWTIASASGFNHDMTSTAAWTLLPDGRLACTGGLGDTMEPSRHAYIITPPTAGEGDDNGNDNEKHTSLVVTTKDGVQTTFVLLDEKPQVTFQGNNLMVSTKKGIVTFPLSTVQRFNYINLPTSGIQDVNDEPDTDISYQDEEGILVLSQLQAGATVGVYTIDGKLVKQHKPEHAGTFRISLSSLPNGAYIVKAGTLTYKILKK